MSTLEIHERRIGYVTVLDMDGNVTSSGGNVVLQKAIRRLIDEGRNKIVLNLARVPYIDSSGLGELISGHALSNNRGGQVKLLNPQQRLQELMTITKLITILDIYDDESEAVNSFKIHDAVAMPLASAVMM